MTGQTRPTGRQGHTFWGPRGGTRIAMEDGRKHAAEPAGLQVWNDFWASPGLSEGSWIIHGQGRGHGRGAGIIPVRVMWPPEPELGPRVMSTNCGVLQDCSGEREGKQGPCQCLYHRQLLCSPPTPPQLLPASSGKFPTQTSRFLGVICCCDLLSLRIHTHSF